MSIRTNYPGLAAAIGSRLARHRARAGLSMAKLSRAVGKSNGYVSQVERGYIVPSLPLLIRLADALGVKAVDMLPGHRDAVRWSK